MRTLSKDDWRELLIKAFNFPLCLGVAAFIVAIFVKGDFGKGLVAGGLMFFIGGLVIAKIDITKIVKRR